MSFAEETTPYETEDMDWAFPNDTFAYESALSEHSSYFPNRFGPSYVPPQSCPLATIPEMVSFGEQDIDAHKFVSANRYDAQKYNDQIFVKPTKEAEPYTRSLYQTPYDSNRNLISTGTLVNPYDGNAYECFENQLPPPNTTKGAALRSTLDHVNPRLVHLNGGYNSHLAIPRRVEQSSQVFAPVSSAGGKPVFGSKTFDADVVKQQRKFAARDLYNNHDGTYSVERSLHGEQPWGYKGYQPMYQFFPVLPATQRDLNLCGRLPNAEAQGTNLTQREQYTGEFYSRKPHVLVTRPNYATNSVNGTEAVTFLPVTTDHTARHELSQGYTNPAHFGSAAPLPPSHVTKPGSLTVTAPTNHVQMANGAVLPVTSVLPTTSPLTLPQTSALLPVGDVLIPSTLRTVNGTQSLPATQASLAIGGNLPLGEVRLPSAALPSLPTSSVALETAGTKVPNTTLPLSKLPLESLPVSGVGLPLCGTTVIAPTLNVQKLPLESLPVGSAVLPLSGGMVMNANMQTPHATLGSLPTTLPTLTNAGNVVVAQTNINGTKTQHVLPPGAVSQATTGQVLTNQALNVRATDPLPALPVGNPSFPHQQALVGQTQVNTHRESQSLPSSEAQKETSGSLLVAQHQVSAHNTVRDETAPLGPVENQNAPYVLVDTHARDTQRMFNPFQSYNNGPELGMQMGNVVPLTNAFSSQNRGVSEMGYVTSMSKVPQGQGGTSTRVIGNTRMPRDRLTTGNYMNANSESMVAQSPKIMPSARLTLRAMQDAKDLAMLD
jgi:hypothetical protein